MKLRASVFILLFCFFMAGGPVHAQDESLETDTVQEADDQISISDNGGVEAQDPDGLDIRQEALQETEAHGDSGIQEAVEQKTEPQAEAAQEAVEQKAEPQVEAAQDPGVVPSIDDENGDVAEKEGSPQVEVVEDTLVQKAEPQDKEAEKEAEAEKEKPQAEVVRSRNSEKQDMMERIEELEKRINELTEESRARRKLEVTEQEKQEKEKEVLQAVGREYSLDAKHSLGLDYTLSYSYTPSERFNNQLIVTDEAAHTIKHTISTTYGILNNLSSSMSLPFVYRYNKLGTEKEFDETDIGDISLGISFQPWQSGRDDISKTFSLSLSLPTGRNPYKINPETELSTGSGIYSISAGGSFSLQVDPVVTFWNFSYAYNMDATGLDYTLADNYVLKKVKTGNSWSAGAGFAYALSYKVSLNTSLSYTYSFSNDYYYENARSAVKSGDSVSATLGMGMGWKLNRKTTLSFSLGYALTGSGFSAQVRVPFNFML